MKKLALIIALGLAPVSASAQKEGSVDEGLDLVERGAQMLLRELMRELDPAITEFERQARELLPLFEQMTEEMGPAFVELFDQLDDLANYEPPEFLPNGDIILRRRSDAPAFEPPLPEPGEEIDL